MAHHLFMIILGVFDERNKKGQDSSSLYDKLRANKASKQAEIYEESKEGQFIDDLVVLTNKFRCFRTKFDRR